MRTTTDKAAFKAALRTKLPDVINRAIKAGHGRAELVQWGTEAGYNEDYVRNLVSKCLIKLGKRARNTTHLRADTRAIELAKKAKAQYGDDAARLLLNASRWAAKHLQ